MKKASFLNVNVVPAKWSPGYEVSFSYVLSFGTTQVAGVSATVTINGQVQPYPSDFLPTTIIDSACPDINGTESCIGKSGRPGPLSDTCLPSSAWALVVVSQFFASIAIIVQAAIAVALFMGKGSRMIHQILSVIAAVFLIISVSSVMNVPARFYSVCLSPMAGQSGSFGSISASYTFDAGGDLPRAPARCLSFYNCPCNRRDQSCSRTHPHLIAVANFEYCGKHGAARWLCGAACR